MNQLVGLPFPFFLILIRVYTTLLLVPGKIPLSAKLLGGFCLSAYIFTNAEPVPCVFSLIQILIQPLIAACIAAPLILCLYASTLFAYFLDSLRGAHFSQVLHPLYEGNASPVSAFVNHFITVKLISGGSLYVIFDHLLMYGPSCSLSWDGLDFFVLSVIRLVYGMLVFFMIPFTVSALLSDTIFFLITKALSVQGQNNDLFGIKACVFLAVLYCIPSTLVEECIHRVLEQAGI